MQREERVTVQGPVKKQQPDGMSHRGGLKGRFQESRAVAGGGSTSWQAVSGEYKPVAGAVGSEQRRLGWPSPGRC